MTLRCERRVARRKHITISIALGLIMGLSCVFVDAAQAQDGAAVPPPPRIKHRQLDTPDPDFQSPLKQQAQFDGGGGGEFRRGNRFNGEGGGNRFNGQGAGNRFNGEGAFGQGGGKGRRLLMQEAAQAGGASGLGGGGLSRGLGAGKGRARRRMLEQRLAEQQAGRFGGNGIENPGAALNGANNFRRGPGRFGNGEAALRSGQGAGLMPEANGLAGEARGGARGGGARMSGMGMIGGRRALDLTPLNLSDEQKQRIRQIHMASRQQAKEVRQQLTQKQMELRNLLFSPDASEQQIRATRRQLRTMQDQMDDVNLNDLLQIRGVLTAEQRQRLPQIAPPAGGQNGGGNQRIGEGPSAAER